MPNDTSPGTLRREYLKRAGALGTLGLAGCVSNIGGGGGGTDQIIVGIWGGSWQDLMIEAVVNPYEEETGTTVEYVVGDNTDRFKIGRAHV